MYSQHSFRSQRLESAAASRSGKRDASDLFRRVCRMRIFSRVGFRRAASQKRIPAKDSKQKRRDARSCKRRAICAAIQRQAQHRKTAAAASLPRRRKPAPPGMCRQGKQRHAPKRQRKRKRQRAHRQRSKHSRNSFHERCRSKAQSGHVSLWGAKQPAKEVKHPSRCAYCK